MKIQHSKNATTLPKRDQILDVARQVSTSELIEYVKTISVPRSFDRERESNKRTARWILGSFQAYGLNAFSHGPHANIVALQAPCASKPCVLLGAHYDTVPATPGADDNGSAVAALLGSAKLIARNFPELPICFVAFNREEDGLLGSQDFVERFLSERPLEIKSSHVLEMVGFCSHEPGSQRIPPRLPIELPDVGDFLGIVGDQACGATMRQCLAAARTYVPELPTMSLEVPRGVGEFFPVLERSDHASFWHEDIPSMMWTDTSEFRNEHYHQLTDTPETLDYSFLKSVTQLLTIAAILDAEEG